MTACPELTANAATLVSSYEELRRFAIDRSDRSSRGVGFTLFMRGGMAAWMSACAPLALQPDASPRLLSAKETCVPADLRTEVAMVLAEMALSAHTEGVAR